MTEPGQDLRAVAGEDPAATPSGPMSASATVASVERETPDGRPVNNDPDVSDEQMSLGRRLRQPRTVLSIVLPLFLFVLFARSLPGYHLEELPSLIAAANGWYLLAAFAIFYAGFPLRGYRWALLIRATGFPLAVYDATEIIFISWMVNCLVPAKLGDLYRAWLLKINSTVSMSRTVGTVFIERILDLFAITFLGLLAGFVSFRSGLPPAVQALFVIGGVFLGILALALLSMRNFGRQIFLFLPIPERFLELYDRFEEGVFSAITPRMMPRLIVLTGLVWSTEAMRLYFVVEAFGFPDVHLGISGAFFVALTGSLLTAVPLTPAGIGIVETGLIAVLTIAYGVPPTQALAITLVDRAISVLSVIVLGGIVYAVSPKRRGGGLRGGWFHNTARVAHSTPPTSV